MPAVFAEIVGHERQISYLRRVLGNGNISHAYGFFGPKYGGKTEVAKALAAELLGCSLSSLSSHPEYIGLDGTNGSAGIDDVRELTSRLGRSSFDGGYKVAVITGADTLNVASQNCLLKTLEEPKGKTVIIMVANNDGQLLPTIRSRLTPLRFGRGVTSPVMGRLGGEGGARAQAIFSATSVPERFRLIEALLKDAKDDEALWAAAIEGMSEIAHREFKSPAWLTTLEAIRGNVSPALALQQFALSY